MARIAGYVPRKWLSISALLLGLEDIEQL